MSLLGLTPLELKLTCSNDAPRASPPHLGFPEMQGCPGPKLLHLV